MKLIKGNFVLFESRKFKFLVNFNRPKLKQIIEEPSRTLMPVVDVDLSNDPSEDKAHYFYLLGLEVLLREIQETQPEPQEQKKLINPSKRK
jgi:hypothetical protein